MIIFSCIILNKIKAQKAVKGKANSWFSLLNRLQLNNKWSTSNELHKRLGAFMNEQGTFLWRPSLDYHLNNMVEFSFGYSYINNKPNEPNPNSKIEVVENNIRFFQGFDEIWFSQTDKLTPNHLIGIGCI